jgi:hypothetical protein
VEEADSVETVLVLVELEAEVEQELLELLVQLIQAAEAADHKMEILEQADQE